MIEIQSLSKEYHQGHTKIHALHNVNLDVKESEFIGVIGKSGSGKSTLLNILGGLDRPSSGDILFNRHSLSSYSSSQLAEYRKRRVGIIFQSFNLIYTQTALENISTALAVGGLPRRKRKGKAMELLSKVGLEDRVNHLPSELSGGESQRVAIARAIANDPKMILADEPTGNLDSETAAQIMDLLLKLNKEEKKTLVLVTHDAETAYNSADHVIRLKDGKIVTG